MLWVINILYRGCKVTYSAFNMHEPRWGSRNNEKLNPWILKSIQLIYDKIVCKDQILRGSSISKWALLWIEKVFYPFDRFF